jgi:ribonuclease BN (tRNA processing enzyme)
VNLTVLGSGGWIPTAERETCCYLVRRGSDVLILDAGTGIRRLLDRRELIDGATSVTILLSHFHLDHVVGLGYLPALAAPESVAIWGPGKHLYGMPTRDILGRLLGSPYFPGGLESVAMRFHELEEGSSACGGFDIRTRHQRLHSEPTLALRIEDAVTYCTDTSYDTANIEFARGSRILFHEAWDASTEQTVQIHSTPREAARVAHEAEVDELILIHVNPALPSADALEQEARLVFPRTTLGADLASFELR